MNVCLNLSMFQFLTDFSFLILGMCCWICEEICLCVLCFLKLTKLLPVNTAQKWLICIVMLSEVNMSCIHPFIVTLSLKWGKNCTVTCPVRVKLPPSAGSNSVLGLLLVRRLSSWEQSFSSSSIPHRQRGNTRGSMSLGSLSPLYPETSTE